MQQGQYIVDRWLEQMIPVICKKHDISYSSYSQNWIYDLITDDRRSRIFGYKFSLNDSVASLVASDKVASYELLHAVGIPAVEHRLIRTKASRLETWAIGLDRIVVKPLDGTSGHGVKLCRSADDVRSYIASKDGISAWAASPFEMIGAERRLIVLDEKVLLQYEKKPVPIDGLNMFNLGLGAEAIDVRDDPDVTHIAHQSMKTIGLRLAAVDIVRINKVWKVLEINDGIMMENYMRQAKENKQKALDVYEQIILKMMF